jgi:hypothetical protein
MRAKYPAHPVHRHFDICEVNKLWSSSLCSLLQPRATSLYLLSTCSRTPSVWDQVPHTYESTGQIIVFGTFYFNSYFLHGSREDKSLWTECQTARLEINLLISPSWMQFRFVTLVPHIY